MTCRQLYLEARRRLSQAGIDSPGVTPPCFPSGFWAWDRPGLALHGEKEPAPEQAAAFLQAVEERAARRPLQYILGEWEFFGPAPRGGGGRPLPPGGHRRAGGIFGPGLTGPPRPPGPGPVRRHRGGGLGAAHLPAGGPLSSVWSSRTRPSPTWRKTSVATGEGKSTARKGDVLSPALAGEFAPGSLDFVASNPPYIETGELATLQPEVRREPALALDGGGDGLVFYRAIAQLWAPLVKSGGLVAVEIGETQGPAVAELFQQRGLVDVEILQDWAGLDRVVRGKQP